MKNRKLLAAVASVFILSLSIGFVFGQDATPEATPVAGSGMITGPMEGEAQSLNGAGATFPQVLYTTWFSDYAKLTNVQINYQGIGSGGGIKGVTDGTLDFGASDAPMSDKQLEDAKATCGGNILHIATALGGVVVTYNIPELAGGTDVLKFTPDTLAGIFSGTITNWKDEKLVADNPALAAVDQPIAVVHRSDGSGTSNIFTSYLKAVNADWAANVGAGTSVNWPTGIGQKGNAGIAGAVKGVPYSLGYVELAYAEQNQLPEALIKNAAGQFVGATGDSVTAAAAGVTLPEDMRIMIVNGEGDATYPIAGFTWLLVCDTQKDAAKATALTRMLWWAIHDGQAYHLKLGYSPLPDAAIKANVAQIEKIMVDGKPALPAELMSMGQ
ncbi:MAG: phosphate ABC transporter substrate-binding protein PstS [Anaerolineaceae bacterium]|nr:phosphate ABC transporter substrate-binding protein PstS [Anaerolineaceae bacterium]